MGNSGAVIDSDCGGGGARGGQWGRRVGRTCSVGLLRLLMSPLPWVTRCFALRNPAAAAVGQNDLARFAGAFVVRSPG
jgi:hypothetical protein